MSMTGTQYKSAVNEVFGIMRGNLKKQEGSALLKEYSPWLETFQREDYFQSLEVPGNYIPHVQYVLSIIIIPLLSNSRLSNIYCCICQVSMMVSQNLCLSIMLKSLDLTLRYLLLFCCLLLFSFVCYIFVAFSIYFSYCCFFFIVCCNSFWYLVHYVNQSVSLSLVMILESICFL